MGVPGVIQDFIQETVEQYADNFSPVFGSLTVNGAAKGIVEERTSEPAYDPGRMYVNRNNGALHVGYDDGSGGGYEPVPPVQTLQEAATFTESGLSVLGDYSKIEGGSVDSSPPVFDVAAGSYNASFDPGNEEAIPEAVTWNNDGTKMYVTGLNDVEVNEYNCSTAFDPTTATFVQNFDLSTNNDSPEGMAWNDDGTKMYIADWNGPTINEYTLTTAYDVSTASFNQSLSLTGELQSVTGVDWGDGGSKLYCTSADYLQQYDCSTAYDVGTATASDTANVSGGADVQLYDGGEKCAIVDGGATKIKQYDCDPPWDITSLTFDSELDVSAQTNDPTDVAWNNDGSKVFVLDGGVMEYGMSYTLPQTAIVRWDSPPQGADAWDLATFAADPDGGSVTVDVVSEPVFNHSKSLGFTPRSITFNDNGSKAYIVDYDNADLITYELYAAYDITKVESSTRHDISGATSFPYGNGWSDDGSRLYITTTNGDVISFTCSTPFDVSSRSLDNTVAPSNTGSPTGIDWGKDGEVLYLSDTFNYVIHTYTASTPYDITTLTFDSSLSTASADGVSISNDGSVLHATGDGVIEEYELSSAHDLSTASKTGDYGWGGQDSNPQDHAWWGTGNRVTMVGDTNQNAYEYIAATPRGVVGNTYSNINKNFDISTESPDANPMIRATLDGTEGSDYPTLEYAARRLLR